MQQLFVIINCDKEDQDQQQWGSKGHTVTASETFFETLSTLQVKSKIKSPWVMDSW